MNARAVAVSVGARTPIGLEALSTGFAHRAATVAMTQSAMLDGDGEPITMCLLSTLDPYITGAERAAQLALAPLNEALEPLADKAAYLRFKILLCVDEYLAKADPGSAMTAGDLVTMLTREAAKRLPKLEDVSTSARGAAGLAFALDKHLDELESGRVDALLIGGVHTDYDRGHMDALLDARRVFKPDNLDALIPGECAAFAVLMRPSVARSNRFAALAEVRGLATAFERARPDNDESAFEATGLTAAARKIGEGLARDGLRAGWMLTDLTFETMRLYELQAMTTRTQKLWCEPQLCDSPAQRLGALGAAAMPLHLVLAAHAWKHGWAPHAIAVSIAGSDAGERAMITLACPSE
jgi:3-oxoacyl-[acyl-carrier-protein] synthase-1